MDAVESEPNESTPNDSGRELRLSFVGLMVGVLVGLGVGYLAWGTDPGVTVPGTVGLESSSAGSTGFGEGTADDLVQQGLVKHTAGDTESAAALYNRALALEPDNSVALFNLGVISHFDGDLTTARTYYEQAVAIDPKFARALRNLGLVLIDQGETERGQELVDRATALENGEG